MLDPSLYIKEPEGAVWKATKFRSGLYDKNGNIAKHVIIDKKPAGYDDGSSDSNKGNSSGYSNEWINGKWYNADGTQTYKGTLDWKSDATGWWEEDVSGWWPSSSWLKIDGYWYYFDASEYMVTNQYVDGWWIGADGVCY